jgi:hypothetical protein
MKNYIVIIALSLLAACSTAPIHVDTNSVPPPVFQPVMPAQIVTLPVQWVVLTQTQLKELVLKNDPSAVYYALDPQNMKNLGLDLAEFQRYIQDERIVILSYQKFYEALQPKSSSK